MRVEETPTEGSGEAPQHGEVPPGDGSGLLLRGDAGIKGGVQVHHAPTFALVRWSTGAAPDPVAARRPR